MSSFDRLASTSMIWICKKCSSHNFSHYPFHYSLLYLTVNNTFDPISNTELSLLELDLPPIDTSPFAPKVHSTPTINSPNSPGPPAQNSVNTPSFGPPSQPTFDTPRLGPRTPISVDTTDQYGCCYPTKGDNWRTVIINTDRISCRKAEMAAMAAYCDPDLMLICETKLDPNISSMEVIPKGYSGEFRRDRDRNGGGVMIVTKDVYTITDLDLQSPSDHNSESIWATISLKDHSKLVVGSFYRPPDKGTEPILDLETELTEIAEKFRNNSKYTVMLGGDFNAGLES